MKMRWLDWGLVRRALPFLALYGMVLFVCWLRVDLDHGWHMRSGEWIAQHGVPERDIFTYTAQDFHWINHEWLHDWLIYRLNGWLGWPGLAAVFAGLWVLAMGLMVRWRLAWPVAAVVFMAVLPYFGVRPVVWSVVGFAVVWVLLRSKRARWLPLVFGLWANLHGGFVLGLVLLGLAAAVRRSWRLAGWLAACGVATLANPYGVGVYTEIWRTMADSQLRMIITEWGPLELTWANGLYVAMAAVALWRYGNLLERVVGGGLLVGSIGANRQLPFFVLVTLPVVMAGWREVMVRLGGRRWRYEVGARAGLGLAAVALVLGVMVRPPAASSGDLIAHPVKAVAALRERPCEGRVFNDYSFGGYLIGELPGVPVYIDGRMPSWVGPEGRYFDRWRRVTRDVTYAEAEFKRYGVRCAVIYSSRSGLVGHLESRGWRKVAEDTGSALWRRD